ncbi:MAG TPA: hypothetical protein VFZ65_01505 [Planctomycetota bacterium]|nr:hypothetical protein [Planctomycetota bacterium]
MGHIRLPHLPRTRRWREVIDLIGSSAGTAAAVASATLDAIDDKFVSSSADAGLVRAFWILAKLPDAARSGTFVQELRDLGVSVSPNPTVAELTAAVAGAIDTHLDSHRQRTDFAEMALAATVESIARDLTQRTTTLFPDAADVPREIAKLGTEVQFGRLAQSFFARFTERCLRYYVDRELPRHVGKGRRFKTLADQKEFSRALELHCQQASEIVEAFAGGWWSKARHERDLSETRTARFVSYALRKVRDELRRGSVE